MKWRGPEQAEGLETRRRRNGRERGSVSVVTAATTAGALVLMLSTGLRSDMETGPGTDTGSSSQSDKSDKSDKGGSDKKDKGPRYPDATCSASAKYKDGGATVAFVVRAAGVSGKNLRKSGSETVIVFDPQVKGRHEGEKVGGPPPTTIEVQSDEFQTAEVRLRIPEGGGFTGRNLDCGTFDSPQTTK